MTKNKVIVVIDESGSMQGREREVMSGHAEMMQTILRDDPTAEVSLIMFSDFVKTIYRDLPIKGVKSLFERNAYKPEGMTALYDAMGKACQYVSDAKTTVVVITDGHENSSRVYNKDEIRVIINHLQRTEKWTFIYLADNVDLEKQGRDIGIVNVASYNNNVEAGYRGATLSVSNSIRGLDVMGGVAETIAETAERGSLRNDASKIFFKDIPVTIDNEKDVIFDEID